MQGVVLAAGAGRRLRPVTLDRSKATVPVAGRLMIERVLDSLADAGIEEFVVVVQDREDDVSNVCRAWAGQRPLELVVQAERLGMAHALLQALPRLRGPFILSACDSVVEPESVCALLAAHAGSDAVATLALERVTNVERIPHTAIVTVADDWVTSIVEKPRIEEAPSDIGSMPLYVFGTRVLDYLPEVQPSPRGEYELQDAIARLIREDGRVRGVVLPRRWQITTVDDLLAINRAFLDRGETACDGHTECAMPVHVGPGVELGTGCRIGPYAVLESGCRVGPGAWVHDAVVLSGSVVPAGATVSGAVVMTAG